MTNVHFLEGEFIPSNRSYTDNGNGQTNLTQFNNLLIKINALETQVQKAVLALKQRETYVNGMAADLDHIMDLVVNKLGNEKNEKKVRIEPVF